MAYGNNQGLMGSSIDPRLFVQDYSGYTRAAEIQAAGMMGAANTAAGALNDYTKEQKEAKNILKASQAQIEAAATLFPDQAQYLGQIANELKNEDTPLSERATIGSQVADIINMGVGQKRYETELGFRQQDQDNQNRESSMRQWAYGQQVTAAEDEARAKQLDTKTKTTIGPALLESVLKIAPAGIADNVRKSIGDYSPGEQFALASSVMALIPKSERKKAPTVQDVAVPGGSQKVQWDEESGTWIPIQTAIQPSPGTLSPESLPEGLKPYAGEFITAGAKYGVDPKVLAAISMHETGNGTSSAFKNKNNAMGVSNANGPIDTGTVGASIDQMARLLAAGTQGRGPYAGKSTIAEIAGTYAPVGAGNDPRGLNSSWESGVSSALKKIGGNPAAPIGFTPTDAAMSPTEKIAVQKYEDEKLEQLTKDSAAAAEAAGFVNALDELQNHPGFNNLFGSNIGVPTWMPGSAGADAKAVLGKVQGKAFLEAIQKMRGMGALSEKEGETATKAYSALTPSMSEEAAKKEIATIKGILQAGIAKASAMTPAATAPQVDPITAASLKLQGLIAPR